MILAGGAESMSMIPMAGGKVAPNPWMVDHRPEIYINMGLTAENLRKKYGIGARGTGPVRATQPSERARGAGRG